MTHDTRDTGAEGVAAVERGPTGICYGCGKRLLDAVGRVVGGVQRMIGGNAVRLHKCCAETLDSDRPLTAKQSERSEDDGGY